MSTPQKTAAIVSLCILICLYKATAEEMTTDLDEVVISATRTDLSKKKVTQAVSVIDHKEIAQQQVTDIHELLRDVPGVSVTQTGGRGGTTSLFIRGGSSNHNLVLIDGVPVNAAGGSFEFGLFPSDNIEKIEVLRGPQSALYGSAAMAAVIQVITKRGSGPTKTDVSAAAGNYGTFEEKAGISGGMGNGGFSVGASRVDSEGILNINNRYGETSFSSRIDQKLYDRINFDVTTRYIDTRYAFPTESSGDRLQLFLDPQQYQKRRRLILTSSLEGNVLPWWKQKLTLGLQNDERASFDPRNFQFLGGVNIGDSSASQMHAVEGHQNVAYSWDFTSPQILGMTSLFTAGIALDRELFEQTSLRVSATTSTTLLDQSRNNYAYYFQNQFNWKDKVFITPSVRVEENEVYGTEANPKISAGFLLPWTQTKFRGTYAQGITEPSFTQTFGSLPTILPNTDLRPERIKGWEVGADQYLWGNKVEANVTYFHNEYKDLLSFITNIYQNIQKAESYGVESSIRVSQTLGHNIEGSLTLSHTYLETKAVEDGGVGGTLFKPGDALLRRPKHRGAVTFNFNHPHWNFNWNTTVQGESIDRDFSKTPEVRVILPAYEKTDIAASVVVLKNVPGFRVFGKIQNLFDVKYEEVFGFSTARINFLAGVGMTF